MNKLNKKQLLIVFTVIVLFSGCAKRISIYDKPGASNTDLHNDSKECQEYAYYQAKQSYGTPVYKEEVSHFRSLVDRYWEDCMAHKGWKYVGSRKEAGSFGF